MCLVVRLEIYQAQKLGLGLLLLSTGKREWAAVAHGGEIFDFHGGRDYQRRFWTGVFVRGRSGRVLILPYGTGR